MEVSRITMKFRPLALTLIAPLIFLSSCGGGGGGMSASIGDPSVLSPLISNTHVSTIASTVPANGDINPYGVAIVEQTVGNLKAGNVLESNFNNSNNLQGTGSTIVQVAPNGAVDLFAQIDGSKLPGACPGGVGLTTALVALRSGWVIVGSLPTTDGTPGMAHRLRPRLVA